MTPTAKKTILFFALLIAVYLQYNAERTVRKGRESRAAATETESDNETETIPVVDHEQYMARALELSQSMASEKKGRGGSVVVKQGKIVGEGWNNTALLNDPEAHAEISSIITACRNLETNDLNGADLYTAVQPCPRCLSLIRTIGIEHVYYCVPRWKMEQSEFGDSQAYHIESMARNGMTKVVEEIQVVTRDAEKYIGL